MECFTQFDVALGTARLPLSFSVGDVFSIQELFTPESRDAAAIANLPILPQQIEMIAWQDEMVAGYLVEVSSVLLVGLREFLQGLLAICQLKAETDAETVPQNTITHHHYAEARRECMNRIGTRLIEVIRQDRRLGLYNLFWLTISKHVITLLDQLIPFHGSKHASYRHAMHTVIAQTFEQVVLRVRTYFQKEDEQRHQNLPYAEDLLSAHLGAAFNYEFSRAIIADQVHCLFPTLSSATLRECAQTIFTGANEKYHLTYQDFLKFYSNMRLYLEGRLSKKDERLCEILAHIFNIPCHLVPNIPLDMLLFHPTVLAIFAEESKQFPSKSRKRTFFSPRSAQTGTELEDQDWEFAMHDYVSFAKDLRRSEVIAFFRNRIMFIRSTPDNQQLGTRRQQSLQSQQTGVEDKISYQFDPGRIINDLRSVTLLFLDLRGFTELSAKENMTDHILKENLYTFFDPVVNIITHFGGTIKSYAGDGILAAFSSASRHHNHALDAVRSAIEIQRIFQTLHRTGKMAFTGMGIGIHTGLVEEAYFFFDQTSPGYNTVIGLAANLTGRLSSGKAEPKKKIDQQTASSLLESLMASPNLDISLLSNVEHILHQAVDTFRQKQGGTDKWEVPGTITVRVSQGVLNNQGIAISGVERGTFDHIRATVELKEIEGHNRVYYTYYDDVLREELVFIKAGDASFKGIDTGTQGKIPVWGVYIERELQD